MDIASRVTVRLAVVLADDPSITVCVPMLAFGKNCAHDPSALSFATKTSEPDVDTRVFVPKDALPLKLPAISIVLSPRAFKS